MINEKERSRRLGTSILNQVVLEAVAFKPPPRTRAGKRGRVYYYTQEKGNNDKSGVSTIWQHQICTNRTNKYAQ
ncbi:hypothetical protein HN873_058526 [Arachis hypogaea]